MRTNDIISTIERMSARGCEFLVIPDSYYENLKKGLESAGL
jgi:4-hydroxyphenylpyruvate dioxygenase-like putative hemolysin